MNLPQRSVALIVSDERPDPDLSIELDARCPPQTLKNRRLAQDRTRTQLLGNVDHAGIVGGAANGQKGVGPTPYDAGMAENVLGSELQACSYDPITGFYRNGCCDTGGQDQGVHAVCVVLTDEFLAFSKASGNDLSTPLPLYEFPGLKAGDRWCLCAARWREAFDAGCAPAVVLEATHARMLEWATLEELRNT